jgi:hypothetical protein
MVFEIVGEITGVEIIAAGPGIRVLRYLRKVYGGGRWRKLKGIATVRLPNGNYIGTKRMERVSAI